MIALAVLTLCLLLLALCDLARLTCPICVRGWAVFSGGRCWRCYRAADRKTRAAR